MSKANTMSASSQLIQYKTVVRPYDKLCSVSGLVQGLKVHATYIKPHTNIENVSRLLYQHIASIKSQYRVSGVTICLLLGQQTKSEDRAFSQRLGATRFVGSNHMNTQNPILDLVHLVALLNSPLSWAAWALRSSSRLSKAAVRTNTEGGNHLHSVHILMRGYYLSRQCGFLH